MQQGCLVIGRNTSGTKEQLDNALTMTGKEIALRYETDQQLANLMTEITNHDFSFYDNYTRLAFYIVNQLYTKETNAKKIYALYNDILHRNSIVTNT
jgi:glycosyltransferase involved in cell wall biosynthesis